MSARTRRAPSPMKKGKPAPVTFAPRSKSKSLENPGMSQCATACAPTEPGSPCDEWTTFSCGVLPSGTLACGRLGSVSIASWVLSSAPLSPFSLSLIWADTAFISASFAANSGEPLGSAAMAAFAAFCTARSCSTSWSRARQAASAPSAASRSTVRCFFAIAARTSSGDSRTSLGSSILKSSVRGARRSTAPYLLEARVDVAHREQLQVAHGGLDDVVERAPDRIGPEEPRVGGAEDRQDPHAERGREVHRPAVVAHDPVRLLDQRRQRDEARVARQVEELPARERAPVRKEIVAGPDHLARAVLAQDHFRELLESPPLLVGPAAVREHDKGLRAPLSVGELEVQAVRLPEPERSPQLGLRSEDGAELEEDVHGVAAAPVRRQGDLLVVEDPGPFPRVAAADLVPGPRPLRHEPRPQEPLHVEHVVELGRTHLAHQPEEALRPAVPLEDVDLVDGLARAHDGSEHLADDPRDAQVAPLRLERSGDLEALDDVAQ